MTEENICPKPNCGKPESTHRWSAGKRLSICDKGHSWDAKELAEKRANTKAAEKSEAATFDSLKKEVEKLNRDIWGIGGRPK